MNQKQQTPNKQDLLNKIKEFASKENLSEDSQEYEANDPRLIEASLEIAESSKSILKNLYYDFRKPNTSIIRRIKNTVITKISNIVRNNMEKPLISQQKFNEQVFFLLNQLLDQNKKLKAEIQELKSKAEK